jgi:hypothetical protein
MTIEERAIGSVVVLDVSGRLSSARAISA